jgi:hypothetical protein
MKRGFIVFALLIIVSLFFACAKDDVSKEQLAKARAQEVTSEQTAVASAQQKNQLKQEAQAEGVVVEDDSKKTTTTPTTETPTTTPVKKQGDSGFPWAEVITWVIIFSVIAALVWLAVAIARYVQRRRLDTEKPADIVNVDDENEHQEPDHERRTERDADGKPDNLTMMLIGIIVTLASLVISSWTPVVFASNTSDAVGSIITTNANQDRAINENRVALATLKARFNAYIANHSGAVPTEAQVKEWAKEAAGSSGVSEARVRQLINQLAATLGGKTLAGLYSADQANAKATAEAKTLAEKSIADQEIELAADILVAKGITNPTTTDASTAWGEAKTLLAIADPLTSILAIAKATTAQITVPEATPVYLTQVEGDKIYATVTALGEEATARIEADKALDKEILSYEDLEKTFKKCLIGAGYKTEKDLVVEDSEINKMVKKEIKELSDVTVEQLNDVHGDLVALAIAQEKMTEAKGWGRDQKKISEAKAKLKTLFKKWAPPTDEETKKTEK